MSLMCMLLYKFLVIGYVTTFIQTNNHNTAKQENPSKDPHYTIKRLHLLAFRTLLLAKGYPQYPWHGAGFEPARFYISAIISSELLGC